MICFDGKLGRPLLSTDSIAMVKNTLARRVSLEKCQRKEDNNEQEGDQESCSTGANLRVERMPRETTRDNISNSSTRTQLRGT